MITTLLWDVDGTLLDFAKSEKRAIKRCFEAFNLGECPDERAARYSAVNRACWEALERGETTKERLLIDRFEIFFNSEGIAFDRLEDFRKEYESNLSDGVYLMKNGLETVKALKNRTKQYVVTNGTAGVQRKKLRLAGLDRIFDGVFISDDLGYEKPSIKYFEAIQERIGKFRKNETMIIGDSLTSDMRGGAGAGIICCWYNPRRAPNDKNIKTDYEITDLRRVERIVNNHR